MNRWRFESARTLKEVFITHGMHLMKNLQGILYEAAFAWNIMCAYSFD